MKHINRIICLLIATFMIASCENSSEEQVGWIAGNDVAAVPTIASVEQSFFDLLDLDNAYAEFVLDVVGDASQIEVLVNFDGIASDAGEFESYATISTFPTTINVPIGDMESLLGVDRNDLVPGDSFNFTFLSTVGTQVLSSQTVLTVQGACPSEIIEGPYDGVTTGATNSSKVVTITSLGGGVYSISDISAGALGALISDPTYDGGGTFVDVCNTLTIPTFNPPGLVPVTQTPGLENQYDPVTGVIVLEWDIIGFTHTTTLTPQ